ncbi:hypothetical protein [Crateriforma spongiae]|uniref:hypothetical protein n=1 Tax=Crateriforma spongiae TaxID=2724528 RepID=UPI0014489DCE|nr:hypothetical protein [Crateriforma spongiae]
MWGDRVRLDWRVLSFFAILASANSMPLFADAGSHQRMELNRAESIPSDPRLIALASDSYLSRNRASTDLLDVLRQLPDGSSHQMQLLRQVRRATTSRDLQLRFSAARVLMRYQDRQWQQRIGALDRSPHASAVPIRLPGWPVYVRLVGDTCQTRDRFAKMVRHCRSLFRAFDDRGVCAPVQMDDPWSSVLRELSFTTNDGNVDPVHQRCRTLSVLVLDLYVQNHNRVAQSQTPGSITAVQPIAARRIATSAMIDRLSRCATSPWHHGVEVAEDSDTIFVTVADHWLRSLPTSEVDDRHLRAMAAYCDPSWTRQIAHCRLKDPISSPITRAAAVAILARASDQDQSSWDWVKGIAASDHRPVHQGYQFADVSKPCQTLVSDVAWAFEIRRQGEDPRDHGFQFCRADPTWGLDLQSLGFSSPVDRHHARQRSERRLKPSR